METLARPPSRCCHLFEYLCRAASSRSSGGRLGRLSQSNLFSSPHRSPFPFHPLFPLCSRRFSSYTFSSSHFSDRSHATSYFVSNTVGGRNKDRLDPLHRRAALIRSPPSVNGRGVPRNSCSFIGSVAFDPRRCQSFARTHHGLGVYTVLQVDTARGHSFPAIEHPAETPDDQSLPFGILLLIYGDLAKTALEYLRRDDFIYVSGKLGSYKKPTEGGNCSINHKLCVKDLNFVARNIGSRTMKKHGDDETICYYGESDSASDRDSEHRERIYLWQVFFANPFEWWDNRCCKRYPGGPDFRNKDTKECLTLRPDDPPWVRKQLEQYDLRRMDRDDSNSYSRVSEWKFVD